MKGAFFVGFLPFWILICTHSRMLAFIATSVKILVSIAACTCKTNCYVMLLEKAPVMMVIAGAPLPLLGPSQWTPCLTSRSEGGWPAVRKSSRKCVLKLWLKSSDPTWLTRLAQSALPLTQKQTVSCSTGAFTGITVCVCVCVSVCRYGQIKAGPRLQAGGKIR